MIVLSHVTEGFWSWILQNFKIEIRCQAKFYVAIQGVPEGQVNNLRGCSVGHCEGKWLI